MRHALVAACLMTAVAVHAQQTSDPIVLDVIVDGGRQRQPLTSGDFVVEQAGRPLTIESARLVEPPSDRTPLPPIASADDERSVAESASRIVAVYLDEYHLSDDAAFAAARQALASFIRQDLGPRDLVVVLKPLDSLVSIRLSGDRESAAAAIESASARQGDYVARSEFERNFIAGAPARIDAARAQIALSSLDALATHLGRFTAGRKTLIVLSNAIPAARGTRGDAPLPGFDAVARAANRARVAIYAVRPSPPPADTVAARNPPAGAPSSGDGLTTLAEQTTGFEIVGPDALAAGLRRVAADASRYYVLTIDPPDQQERDGRFRRVDVTLRRSGPTVRARAGYALRRPENSLVARGGSTLPPGLRIPRRTTSLIRTWFGQSAADDGRTHVEFVWEPSPRPAGQRGAFVAPARVSMVVTTMEGAAVFSGESSPAGRDLVGNADRATLAFASAPGRLLVQMQVLDAAGRVLDTDARDLVVNAFEKPVAFGSAAVYRARTVRELRALDDADSGTAPVATRQFSRTETLVVRVPIASHGDEPAVTVRLLSRFGSVLRTLPAAREKDDVVRVDLPLAPLASGGYVLEFGARSGAESAVLRVDFGVTP